MLNYFNKMRGNAKSPSMISLSEIMWSWIASLIGVGTIGYIEHFYFKNTDLVLIIGSFGASAVLVFGAIESPMAQPKNLIGGHIISAAIGVASFQLIHNHIWLTAGLAVSTAIAAMHASKTLHPPGGATALIAVIGSDKIHDLGYMYILLPAGSGALIMLAIALLINNIPKNRKYPLFWY